MAPIAHAGHRLQSLLYLAPIVITTGVLALTDRRDQHTDRDEHPDS